MPSLGGQPARATSRMKHIIIAHPETTGEFVLVPLADEVWEAARSYAREQSIKTETVLAEAIRAYVTEPA